jgi:cell division protein FtsN
MSIPPPPGSEKKSWYQRWWGIALIAVFGLAFIGNLGDDTPTPERVEAAEVETVEKPTPKPKPAAPKPAPKPRATPTPAPTISDAEIADLAMSLTWGQSSAAEQRTFCEGYRMFGPEISHQFFLEGWGPDGPSLAAFKRFYDGVC